MKILLISYLFLSSCLCCSLYGQSYIVMKMIGKVEKQIGQKTTNINPYDKLKTNDKLAFTDRLAGLRVLLGSQVYSIKLPTNAVWNPTMKVFTATLKDALFATNVGKPTTKPLVLSLRSEERSDVAFANTSEFIAFLAASDSVLSAKPLAYKVKPFVVLEELACFVPKQLYLLDKQSYFFLRFTFKGQVQRMTLPTLPNNTFVLRKSLFDRLGVLDVATDLTDLHFCYHSPKGDEVLHRFQPLFLSSQQIKVEVLPLVQSMRQNNKSATDIATVVYDYVNAFYGRISKDAIKVWYEKSF